MLRSEANLQIRSGSQPLPWVLQQHLTHTPGLLPLTPTGAGALGVKEGRIMKPGTRVVHKILKTLGCVVETWKGTDSDYIVVQWDNSPSVNRVHPEHVIARLLSADVSERAQSRGV
jgi:hypothetical protein